MNVRCVLLAALAIVACAPAPRTPSDITLHGVDGESRPLANELHSHFVTVVTFFSAHCPCQAAHDARLRELVAKYAPRGVGFVIVDSEESATLAEEEQQSRARGYPIVLDDHGALARALDAEYATYSVLLDRNGRVVYRGGLDSDRSHLREDRTPFLADAIDDVLEGHTPRRPEAKALGCALQLR